MNAEVIPDKVLSWVVGTLGHGTSLDNELPYFLSTHLNTSVEVVQAAIDLATTKMLAGPLADEATADPDGIGQLTVILGTSPGPWRCVGWSRGRKSVKFSTLRWETEDGTAGRFTKIRYLKPNVGVRVVQPLKKVQALNVAQALVKAGKDVAV